MRLLRGVLVGAVVTAGVVWVDGPVEPAAAQTVGCCFDVDVAIWDESRGSYVDVSRRGEGAPDDTLARVYADQGELWLRLTFSNTSTQTTANVDTLQVGGSSLGFTVPMPPGTREVREVSVPMSASVARHGSTRNVTATYGGFMSGGWNMCACWQGTNGEDFLVVERPAPPSTTTTEPPATTVAPPSTEAPATTAAPTTTAAPATTASPVTTAAPVITAASTTVAPTTAAPTTAAPTTAASTTTSSSVATADVEITEAEGSDGGRPWVPFALAAGGGTTGLAALGLVWVRRRRSLAGSEIYPS